MASTVDLKKLKIAELRKELTERGLSSKGNKAELVLRLTEHLDGAGGDVHLGTDEDAEAVLNADDEVEDLLNPDHDEDLGDEDEDEDAEAVLEPERKVEVEPLPEPGEEKEKAEVEVEVKKIAVQALKTITDVEKKALRAQKFGVSGPLSDADRKKARAERFGMPATGAQNKAQAPSKGISVSMDTDKLKQRAERFGKSVSPTAIKTEEAERIRKRKERFGAVVAGAGAGAPKAAKIVAPGDDDAEAKKRKRAERFGMA